MSSKMIEAKTRLCKMLAMEDLNVVHKKGISTAAIDLKSRTVFIPMWKAKNGDDLPGEVHDILISHEGYGHGVNTPIEGWHSSLENHSRSFKSFLNIIEDARIEKLVKRKYPGIRKSYIKGYKWIVDNGIFGEGVLSKVNNGSLKFIDRLNIHAKVGSYAYAVFTNDEMVFVDRMENLETWDEVVKLAEDLFTKAKEDKEKENPDTDDGEGIADGEPTEGGDPGDEETETETGEGSDSDDSDDDAESGEGSDSDDAEDDSDDGDDSGDGEGSDGDDSDEDSDDSGDGKGSDDDTSEDDSDGESDDSEKDDGASKGNEGGDDSNFDDDDLTAETDSSFEDNMKDMVDDSYDTKEHDIVTLPKNVDARKLIVGYKTVIAELTDHYGDSDLINSSREKITLWKRDNTKVVNYLVKEFEMKKAADEYTRSSIAKTGVLDPAKLHSYQYNDDIFKKVATVTGGKNHGLLMFLDWSGSMTDNLSGTMDQLFNLVSFCRKVNIPFNVYAFTDHYRGDKGLAEIPQISPALKEKVEGDMVLDNDLRFLELFSSKMNGSDFNKGMLFSRMMADGMSWGYYSDTRPGLDYILGGTPLNATIVASMDLVKRFKEENQLQVVNTVFLTDGASAQPMKYDLGTDGKYLPRPMGNYNNLNVVKDPITKKEYSLEGGATKGLLKALRDMAGVNVAGFFLASTKKNDFSSVSRFFDFGDTDAYEKKAIMHKEFKKEKFLVSTDAGYNELYIIANGKELQTANTNMEDLGADATKAQIRRAFIKSGKGKLKNRVVLSKFIDMVA